MGINGNKATKAARNLTTVTTAPRTFFGEIFPPLEGGDGDCVITFELFIRL